MNNLIVTILVIILFLILITFKNREFFYQNSCIGLQINRPDENKNKIGFHTRVYPNNENYYDEFFGPKCLNTCIIEHIPKINLKDIANNLNTMDDEEVKNILKWNRENPSKNFCHNANVLDTNSNLKKCTGDCINKCGKNRLESDNNEGFDYTHCINNNNVCTEKLQSNSSKRELLNFLSGGGILNSTRCSGEINGEQGCVNKYMNNINTIKNIYDNYKSRLIEAENAGEECIN